MSEGHVLVDEVGSFTLTTYKGDQPWVLATDDITDLSTIQIDLTMTREDSDIGDKPFTTTVRPRNTKTQ